MVTSVPNKLINVTIFVYISGLGFIGTVCVNKALFVRHLRWKHAVHSSLTCCVFHNPDSNCYFYFFHAWTVRRVCVTGKSRSTKTKNLTLDWRRSDVLLPSTFTRGKTLTFLNMQKMCAEVDAPN